MSVAQGHTRSVPASSTAAPATTSTSANGPELTLIVDAGPDELDSIERAVRRIVDRWWAELAVPGRARLLVEARPGARIGLLSAGEPLHLSAWRWEQALSVAVGERRSVSSQIDLLPTDWAKQLWAGRAPSHGVLAAEVVDAMLRTGTAEVLTRAGIEDPGGALGSETVTSPIFVELPLELVRAVTSLPPEVLAQQTSDFIVGLAGRFGVTVPGVRLTISDSAAPVVRLHYAGRATPPYLLTTTDPASVIAEVMALLGAETPLHLGLWLAADPGPWAAGLDDLPVTADQVAHYLPDVRRRLVDEQATVMSEQPIVEAILRVLADQPEDGQPTGKNASLIDAMEDRARGLLGPAVLGQLPHEYSMPVVTIEDISTTDRTPSQIREDLFTRRPELAQSWSYTVLLVPRPQRREVARSMHPLADVIRVAAREEFPADPALIKRRAAIYEQSQVRRGENR